MKRWPESEEQKTGIGRYGDKAERNILVRGARCSSLHCFTLNIFGGLFRTIMGAFVRPFIRLMKRNESTDIYHAVEELSGIYLPFAKGKKVVTFHHITAKGEDFSRFGDCTIFRIIAGISIRYADVVLAVSPQTRDELIKKYKKHQEKIKVLTVEIGDQFGRIENVERSKSVLCVSSLIPRKNVAALIRSFKNVVKMPEMSDAKLIICGIGSEYENIKQLTKDLDLCSNTEFVSGLNDEEIVGLYNSASVSVLPTSHEGLGLTIIEAQRCYTPVLYFRDAQIPEEVKRYAVPCADEDELSEQMFRCLSDEKYRDSIADAAFKYASEFGNDFGDRLFEIYEELLK